MNLVIVESPAKAKTINKYLGADYEVVASYGHVRDLPSKNGSVLPDEDFKMTWEVDSKAAKTLNAIASSVKKSEKLILATDPDREGEAISWHILEVLKKKGVLKGVDIQRVVFNAITKSSVLEAIANPRELDEELVDAYLARRALDYLVGFTLSPVLWRKLPGSRSAGRVQSVALRIICDRELEIEAFKAEEYWTVEAQAATSAQNPFGCRLTHLDGKKLDKFSLNNEQLATDAKAKIEAQAFEVGNVEQKPGKRNPYAPFTTSTLQQEAARKLGFAASRTMQLAQRLYEGITIGGETTGLITYMRTDGIDIAPEAISAIRNQIQNDFGDRYLPKSPRIYKSKQKNAQEAHEAIRPTDTKRTPAQLAPHIDKDQLRLYELIWKRTIACQMESAQVERTTIDLTSQDKNITLRATGTVVVFDGFLKLYEEGSDDASDDENGKRLPKVTVGESVNLTDINADQHFTEPPPRYTEASLVKKLEELGIGRPSTYASTLSVLRDRNYVHMDQKRFVPEDKGRIVIAFLENFFERYVEYDFTASLEEKLDEVSAGKLDWKEFLTGFWTQFHAAVDSISGLRITEVLDALNESLGPHIFPETEPGQDPRKCPSCDEGRLSLKVGKFGAFIGCSNYPDCNHTRQLSVSADGKSELENEPKLLGKDPETDIDIFLKSGRFGPYVQLGEDVKGEKPKRGSVPRGFDPFDIDLEKALYLLSLPREIGIHPESQKPIKVGLGRFGPYVLHDGTYASIKDVEEFFTIGLNRAVTILAEKPKGRGGAASLLKELGEHPDLGGEISVRSGRFGPYIKHGKINASLPKGDEVDDLTLDRAVELIALKAAKAGAKPKAKTKAKAKAKTKTKAKSKTKAKAKTKAKTKAKAKTKTKSAATEKVPSDAAE